MRIELVSESGTPVEVRNDNAIPQIGWRIAIEENTGTTVYVVLAVTQYVTRKYDVAPTYRVTIAPLAP